MIGCSLRHSVPSSTQWTSARGVFHPVATALLRSSRYIWMRSFRVYPSVVQFFFPTTFSLRLHDNLTPVCVNEEGGRKPAWKQLKPLIQLRFILSFFSSSGAVWWLSPCGPCALCCYRLCCLFRGLNPLGLELLVISLSTKTWSNSSIGFGENMPIRRFGGHKSLVSHSPKLSYGYTKMNISRSGYRVFSANSSTACTELAKQITE